jgi:siroheme decarboxylase
MIDDLDKKIIALLQKDLPLDPKPFAIMAEHVGITEDQFVARVKSMIESGVIRRFGATLYHQEAGFSSRAMAEFREVTHCYQRKTQRDWRYNLYTMIHGDNRDECYEIARRISQSTGINEYTVLFSEKEFKKTSMEYF